ncbi:hypothetical protein RhiirA4_480847 [Rhizophagus irregularis]|uniref:RING-type domain-containing protein n=1 Tax=Rhizophagus irregularis TaxID=588596 RepID=A0A2I1HIN0_9GLOM|nr:hypothetical protein RhiirA4_480847 [Rhizophagus irregularis]
MESITKFMLYSLKQIPQEIIDRANNQEPDPCYVCNAPILTQIFNKNLALVLLPCGHIHHEKCIRNLTYGSRCPFPYCTEIIENAGSILANMQAQEQKRLEQELESCRELNSSLILGTATINIVANKFGKYPKYFPSNISQFKKLTGTSVDGFLEFYDLPTNGGRHQGISSVYVSQKYTQTPKIIRENITHLALFRAGGSRDDISRIVRQYTDDPKKASKIINRHLRDRNFVVFDFTKATDDPLAIRQGWDTALGLG